MTEQVVGGIAAGQADPGASAAPQTVDEFVTERNNPSGGQPGPAAPPESAPGLEQSLSEGAPQNPEEYGSEPEGKPNKAVSELIAQRRKRQEAEKEAAYWRGVAESRAAQEQAQQQPVYQGPPIKPTIEQFETYEQFEAAREQWMDDMVDYRAGQIHQRVTQAATAETIQQAFVGRLMETEKTNPTIRDAFNDVGVAINQPMADFIRISPAGPQVLLYLHDHMDETSRLARMNPMLAIAELGRIEGRYAPRGRATASPHNQRSSAPPPVKPVVNNGSPVSVDLEKGPIEDFMATRNKAQYGR